VRDFDPVYVGLGSKAVVTAPQQQRPLHLNQRTCRGKPRPLIRRAAAGPGSAQPGDRIFVGKDPTTAALDLKSFSKVMNARISAAA